MNLELKYSKPEPSIYFNEDVVMIAGSLLGKLLVSHFGDELFIADNGISFQHAEIVAKTFTSKYSKI